MNKNILSLLLAALLILLHACKHEDELADMHPQFQEVAVVFEQPGMDTRSSEGENVIHDFWFFQFDHTGRLVQKPIFKSINDFNGHVPLMKMGSGQNYDCIFVVNAGSSAFNDLTLTDKAWISYTFDDLKDAHAPFTNYYGEHPMLMSGEGVEKNNDGTTRVNDHTTQMTCSLRHNAAKVMLTVELPMDNLANDEPFRLQEIHLVNAPHHLRYYHIDDVDAKDSDYINTPELITFTDNEDEVCPQVLKHPAKNGSFTTTLYLPSNPKGNYTVSDLKKRKELAPAGATDLMLRINYGANGEKPVSYHIFVGTDLTNYNVLSNHSYQITAKIHGYDTENDSRIEFLYDILTVYLGMEDYKNQWGQPGNHPIGDTEMKDNITYTE